MRTWWPPWRRAWLSLSAPRIHGTRWFIGTQSRCHSSRKRARPGPPPRDEDADERGGTATVLVLTEPRTGWRTIDISGQRPAVDGAPQSTQRLDDGSPEAAMVTLGCDTLTTPKMASLSEALAPTEARRLARRLEVHSTPTHGSGWHSAESARSVRTQQCLHRRSAAIETLRQATKAWEHARNANQTGVDRHCTTDDARIRLKRLYPQFQD